MRVSRVTSSKVKVKQIALLTISGYCFVFLIIILATTCFKCLFLAKVPFSYLYADVMVFLVNELSPTTVKVIAV